ncbi:MAG: HAD family hydrolase [Erysipelotrichaceae bacterium]
MIKLVVLDVDGTLIEKGTKNICQSTIDSLNCLHTKGMKLAIASGRPPYLMENSFLKDIPFDYFICNNGTITIDNNQREVFKTSLSVEEVNELISDFKDDDNAIMFQFKDNSYCFNGKKRLSNMLRTFIGNDQTMIDERENPMQHYKELPCSAVCYIKESDIARYRRKYKKYSIVAFDKDYYDIMDKKVNKGNGVKQLSDKLGIKMNEVMAFGDDLNDVEMINCVGIGICMGDGKTEVKAVADYITKTSKEEGIYLGLKHFGLLED